MAADDIGLTGLWFCNQKYFGSGLLPESTKRRTIAISDAETWLDVYFSGQNPDFTPALHFIGTPFQCEVWEYLCMIPYGKTTTYGLIANQIAKKHGKTHMSAQAVGSAVGRNRISIIIPCHRVIGTNGSLTGYAGGIDRKSALLRLENAAEDELFIPITKDI